MSIDKELKEASAAKTVAWKTYGYGSPEHRKAQAHLANLLRKNG